MLKTFSFALATLFISQAYSQEQTLNLVLSKSKIQQVAQADEKKVTMMNQFTLLGYKEAVNKAFVELGFDQDRAINVFWERLEASGNPADKIISLIAPVFNKTSFLKLENIEDPENDKMDFKYEIDKKKLKKLFSNHVKEYVIYSDKNIYIIPEITIDETMQWSDVGVSKSQVFTDVIVDSWVKWAAEKFPGFDNVVVINQDFKQIPEDMNSESVTIKWTSHIKKAEVFHERQSALFDVSAQYVVNNIKSAQNLTAFDFPHQKNEYSILKDKELSSNLASLIFNLLNSQSAKIATALEFNKASSTLHMNDFIVKGDHGFYDITLLTNALNAKYKDYAVVSELKAYSNHESIITIRSTASRDSLDKMFSTDSGKVDLNEQKILTFDSIDRAFAIIPKQIHNEGETNPSNE